MITWDFIHGVAVKEEKTNHGRKKRTCYHTLIWLVESIPVDDDNDEKLPC